MMRVNEAVDMTGSMSTTAPNTPITTTHFSAPIGWVVTSYIQQVTDTCLTNI